MTDNYVELHAASAFSFLEGASLPESLIDQAAGQEMAAIALLDRNGLYGAARFYSMAKKSGVRAHIGSEVSIADGTFRVMPPAWLPHQHTIQPPRLPLLCKTQRGYQNLCQLITRLKMREPHKCEGAATLEELEEFSGDLVCLTGGEEGPLAAALTHGGEAEGHLYVERLMRIYGHGNVYVEMQRHGEREEEWRNQAAVAIASRLRLPLIATNGVRYATPAEREIVDLFTCIRHHTDLDHGGRLLSVNAQRYLKHGSQMATLFNDYPEAIENTHILSQTLQFELNDLGYQFPQYETSSYDTMDSFLRKRVEEGIVKRYRPKKDAGLGRRAARKAEQELQLIEKLGFAGYFLIVWDIICFCQQNNILVQGRGSAANSVVCYALEITAIDPIGMDLLFERFLSESRGEWPDIDLDLPSGEQREKAIQYIYRRYGELGAAMTANVITYRGKSAAREVGKALGFDEEAQGRLSSLVGQWEWRKQNETLSDNCGHAGFDLSHPRIAKYAELCGRIQNLPRHLGQHSGGMVICKDHLNRVVPIERAAMSGRTVLQWDKEDCSELRMIKVDLLGLGMMAVIQDCLELIPRHHGDPVDLAQLPQDDPEVFEVLRRADTVGMFQVESRAQMASLPRNAPEKFYDLVVQVAIIRPGPIVGKMMHPYMRRRQKKEPVTYPTESLRPVLERTLGVPLFQEQLLRMSMTVANFSGSEAEELRNAIGMRRSMARMKELEAKLRSGMTSNKIDIRTQEMILESIASFALYGFPESHAASFALIAYASAYFKVKYLAAFTCAMLNNQPMGFYSPAVLVKDAQRHGLRVRPIDIHKSERRCTVEHEPNGTLSVRMGLTYVKGLSAHLADAIVWSREVGGVYRSTDDLARRVPTLNRKDLTQLASVGALNQIDGVGHRRDALWQVEQVSRPSGPLLREAGSGLEASVGPLKQMSHNERLTADYSGTGITTGPHPMTYQRTQLRKQGVYSALELQQRRDGEWVKMAGCVIARQRPGTAQGFIFLSLEDETGIGNIIITPQLYEQNRALVTRSRFLEVEGKLQNQDGVIHVKAVNVRVLTMTELQIRSHDFH